MINEKMANLREDIAKNQKEGEASWWPLEKIDGIEYQWQSSGLVRGKFEDGDKWIVAEESVEKVEFALNKYEEIERKLKAGEHGKSDEAKNEFSESHLAA